MTDISLSSGAVATSPHGGRPHLGASLLDRWVNTGDPAEPHPRFSAAWYRWRRDRHIAFGFDLAGRGRRDLNELVAESEARERSGTFPRTAFDPQLVLALGEA